jgi:hypothetical protein
LGPSNKGPGLGIRPVRTRLVDLPGPGICRGTSSGVAREIPPVVEVRLMVRRIWPAGAASRAALATIAAGALAAVAACGSAAAGGHFGSAGGQDAASVPGGRASAGVALCRDLPNLTSVAVSRTTSLHVLEPAMVLPRGITVRKRHLVRGLATALCGLPKMPRGPVSCPARFAGSLRLAFAAGGRPFRSVIVQISGCRVVSGLGPARTVPSAAFWRTLGKDLGLTFPPGMRQPGGNP